MPGLLSRCIPDPYQFVWHLWPIVIVLYSNYCAMQYKSIAGMPMTPITRLTNTTYDELTVGLSASLEKRLTMEDIRLFAVMTGDVNPVSLDAQFAKSSRFHDIVAHGMWGGALVSTVLGTTLPGAGTLYVSQSLDFLKPVRIGDALTVTVTVREKRPEHQVVFDCDVVNQLGDSVLVGEAVVIAPTEKVESEVVELPDVFLNERRQISDLLKRAEAYRPLKVAVVHPCDEVSLGGALAARARGLIDPILIGPPAKIQSVAQTFGFDLTAVTIDPVEHSHAACQRAVELCQLDAVESVMKGSLHTDELMAALLSRASGLRTERRVSHVFVFDVPTYPRPLLITDAAINISPDLMAKRDIIQNAIELAQALQIDTPKVAILSAVETVTSTIPSTLDAAALCTMARRGQITGGILDGPLAFDNAVSETAARIKGIESPVAGQADILVTPDLESGNMLAKQLEYLAHGEGSGIVLGLRLPVILTSRADDAMSRLASCALAVILHAYRRGGQ